ncbi:hypothetical protein EC991_009558 [Linnemannia zychae]|nr:hypothetical protein EC991_009558 [Linnemannia zychae]
MEETRSFRLTETLPTAQITLSHVEGQNIVSWEDIEQVFPGVKRVRNGIRSRLVLDVVFCTSVEPNLANPLKLDPIDGQPVRTDTPADAPVEDTVITALDITPETTSGNFRVFDTSSSPSSNVNATSKATHFQQVVTRASRKARESEIEQRFISLLEPELQEKVRTSSDIYQAFAKAIKDGEGELSRAELRQDRRFQKLEGMVARNTDLQEALYAKQVEARKLQEEAKQLQEAMYSKQQEAIQLQEQVLNNQKEMKQMQQRALDQLSVLHSRVQALLTQTYELHEYPIPRLFIVLPQDPSRWDATNPFSNKFRLYFLCECGEHTKSIDSKTEVHIAKHEGYEIVRPTEFFQLYGSHVFTILKMLTFGISVAGVAVPAISHLVRADFIDQAATYLKLLQDIEPMIDPVIKWMDKVSENEGEAVDEFTKQMENKEALAGADLRKLDTFLKAKDGDKVLGNLYRTVTDEGHVKWVCIDHYRENYQNITAKDFQRVLDSVGGLFDKNNGRVVVALRLRVLAEQFFSALGKARSVYELDIFFDWACTTSDLELLEGAFKMSTRISILKLDLQNFQTSKLLSASSQYGALFRIKGLPHMRTIHVSLKKNVVKILSSQPKTSSCHCKLTFGVRIIPKEFTALAEVLKTNNTLTTLNLWSSSIGDDGAQALAEALKTNKTVNIIK